VPRTCHTQRANPVSRRFGRPDRGAQDEPPAPNLVPSTTVFRFEPSTFELGLTYLKAAPGEHARAYDPARTVVDLIRLRHRIGDPTALAALHRYLRRRDARPAELLTLGAALRVHGPVLHALDVASAG
jgi:hypothetical protein